MPGNDSLPDQINPYDRGEFRRFCTKKTAVHVYPRSAAAQLPPVPVPNENPITEEKRVLGKILFWEEQLSSDNTVACGTCHRPGIGGADPRPGMHPGPDSLPSTPDDIIGSPGIIRSDVSNAYEKDPFFELNLQVTGRAAPTFFGTLHATEQFWDGRGADQFLNPETGVISISSGGSLESQAVGPILSEVEMGHIGRDWDEVTSKLTVVDPLRLATNVPPDMAAALSGGVSYPTLFTAAFGDDAITAERIGFAIATYERTLVPDNTPWDRYSAGDTAAMTAQQEAGWELLRDHTVCFNCHVPPLFTDNLYHNIGLRPANEDLGRMEVTGLANDAGRFKTPSLRNVGLKAALMHVGWITDVQDSIDFYNAPASPAVDPITRHTQFTADQSGIPTGMPGVFADYNDISMPDFFHVPVVDFLENGLTDPRVMNEEFPFDRPTLHSEIVPHNPDLFGSGSAGSGSLVPRVIAMTPAVVHNPDFKVGIADALGGAAAYLVISGAAAAPGAMFGAVPLNIGQMEIIRIIEVPLSGAGAGNGVGTFKVSIGNRPGVTGQTFFGQWFVEDPMAPDGYAASPGVEWTGL